MRASEILRNAVKEKLARNELVASMTVRLVRGIEIARIVRTAGFDMIYIDMEYASLSLDTAGQICRAALIAGIAPFVRVPGNAPETMSRILDGGGLSTRPKLAAEFIAMGARMISTGFDILFLLAAATEKARQVHEIPV